MPSPGKVIVNGDQLTPAAAAAVLRIFIESLETHPPSLGSRIDLDITVTLGETTWV